ncbi:MAG: DUF1800 family protein [Opitutales bacterium]|nr:DUF1800 family protein [Opitutales bacterium]
MKHIPLYLFAFPLFISYAMALDENGNGLSDVWEQRFNASDLVLEDDDDGDRFTNLEECIAGTDPNDSTDHPQLFPTVINETGVEMQLHFDTLRGKSYTVSHSSDLTNFYDVPPSWSGDNATRSLSIQNDGVAETLSSIRIDFWSDLPGDTISDLHDLSTYPSAPDGTAYNALPKAPDFLATGYGARLSCWIEAPQTGAYTFFLTAGGPAELYLDLTPDEKSTLKIAEVLPTQTGLAPSEWDTYATQRSDAVDLIAGNRYHIELHYVSTIPRQHAQIAWSLPGTAEIELLERDDLAKVFFHTKTVSGNTLLEHDYDSIGQTGTLWPNNTSIEAGPTGTSGDVERVSGNVGTGSEERLTLGSGSSDHFYATWLFNMGSGAQDSYLYFMNGSDYSQEGPRIDIEDSTSNPTGAVVRAGGSGASEAQVDILFDKTFRIEMVLSLAGEGFEYRTPTETLTVAADTFDIYVSDTTGNLIGSATSLNFKDLGANLIQSISTLRMGAPNTPNIVYDDWFISTGNIPGEGYLVANEVDFGGGPTPNFFKFSVEEQDQDSDIIPDWEELALAPYANLLFFDSETINGTPDVDTLQAYLAGATGLPDIALYGSDACAMESNYPNTIPDDGEITITREGVLTPVTVHLEIIPLEETGSTVTLCDGSCCMLVGTAGDEAAEIEDYQIIDEDGNIITDSVHFEFGERQKILTVKAINDEINEYPETLNIGIAPSPDSSYTISTLFSGASIQLFDLPDSPDNLTIFTGAFSQDGKAVNATSGSGSVTATINGPRTEMRFWNQFSNLNDAQQDSHVHKANPGNTAGSIIYAITNTPGDESGASPGSDPFNGQLKYYPVQVLAGEDPGSAVEGDGYPWDLQESSGAVPTLGGAASKQTIIDSLFGQNGETSLYLNVHTVSNPAGEIWGFLNLSEGSISDPGDAAAADAPGTSGYPQLSGDLLEAEVRRFLNQATFGATDASVAALLNTINAERVTDPNYHRHSAYETWIDDQMNPTVTKQTFLLDYFTATYFQYLKLSGVFDPARNITDTVTPTPTTPATWPTINRDAPNSELWYLSAPFPITRPEYLLADDTNNLISSTGYRNLNRSTFSHLMLNAKDQLRQKMGFSLQQIVVVSNSLSTIEDQPFATVNYQDQFNHHAFGYYRSILGYVNWSPLMGAWLSSLKNQKAIDFDGDGLFDTYPDENLARENMQLFTIGLFNIWPDGKLRLTPNGLPEASYTNADIQEFAKILTGQSFSLERNTPNGLYQWGGVPYAPDNDTFNASTLSGPMARQYLYPMKMFGDYHSLGPKTFAGTTIDNSALPDFSDQGIADVEAAIDWLAGKPGDGLPDFDMVNSHISTPAFVSRRLIQRFTTSNPSTEYLHRVATVFKNSEGHLGLTVKAILLDPEARNLDVYDTQFGLKKSPLEGYLQLLRAFDAYSYIPLTDPSGASPYDAAPASFANADLFLNTFDYPAEQLANHERNARFMFNSFFTSGSEGLQMNPFDQETVFNFYLPDFNPGGAIGAAGLVSPELQLANEQDIIRNINYFEQITLSESGQGGISLGNTSANQRLAYGVIDNSTDSNDNTRLPLQAIADAFYPATAPDNSSDPSRSPESLADEAILDELDKRLTNGIFKIKYPYDPNDDDDPSIAGVDDLLKNPRELIIDSITGAYGDPFNGSNDDADRRDKLENILFLITFTPEYQIKK